MLYLRPKQKKVVELANDPTINTIVLLGAVGTGKVDTVSKQAIAEAVEQAKAPEADTRTPAEKRAETIAKRKAEEDAKGK